MNDAKGGLHATYTSVPQSSVALLIIDMISDFEFEDGQQVYKNALKVVKKIADLKSRAKAAGVPVIYLNDNYGRWNEDFASFVRNIKDSSRKGREIISILEPQDDDLFVLKPQRSGFYGTSLGVLLLSMGVSNIILTGVTSDICILFTAHDAYMRGYNVHIPSDGSASADPRHHTSALSFLKRIADADIRETEAIDFGKPKTESNEAEPTLGSNFSDLVGDLQLAVA
jgi:nicotinamidase-related amidase